MRGRSFRLLVQQNTRIKTLGRVSFLIDGIAGVDTYKKHQKENAGSFVRYNWERLFSKIKSSNWARAKN